MESPADPSPVLLLAVLAVSVPVLPAGLGSAGLAHCLLAGDPSPTHASPLRPPGPVGRCGGKWLL